MDNVGDEEAAKARRKELHRKSMIWTGAMIAGAALAAAWIGFAPDRLMPRLGSGAPAWTEPPAAKMAVRWREFGSEAFAEARKLDRPILLSLSARWARPSRVMDAGAYSDERVGRLLEKEYVAVRIDADLRPDLTLRYLGSGWPTTALLLPTGEVLSDGTFMDADTLLNWVGAIGAKFRTRRADIFEAAAAAAKERAQRKPRPAGDPRKALEGARDVLAGTWAGPAVFPRFDRLLALTRLKADWAPALARAGTSAALSLQDPDGGLRRAQAPDGSPAPERRLGEQADALRFLAAADPKAAARLRRFVKTTLALPGAGYKAAVWPGGEDARSYCDESVRMAAAVLEDPESDDAEGQHALATIELFWEQALGGLTRRGVGAGPVGLLGDQLGLLEAIGVAHKYTGSKVYRERGERLAKTIEATLLDEKKQAFYDRLPAAELPEGLDRVRFAGLNARARRVFLARGDKARAKTLADWLWAHPQGLDAGDLAELAEERLSGR